ncbi:hypothetical protein STRTUCAR8_10247 [Streptomyces turgidiscabies Car8]|uniref:Uncharacterized protein n=1 Tax=Streptomyces turgidiscabies (strain Car8) TaxID=698760 RepID=L7F5N2_STRT8|nr:hypothetical protein STRTUCAR8_10247 [Streptomyces turgidiscabies Car8]
MVSRAINASLSSGVAFSARFARETQLASVVSLIPRSSTASGTASRSSSRCVPPPHETPP